MNIQLESLSLASVSATDHYYRPYVGHSVNRQHEIIGSAIEGVQDIHKNVNEMARLAPNMISLQAPTCGVDIPNGWGTKRFSFKLTFKERPMMGDVENTYIMSGYTDMLGCNFQTETIDEQTKFFISTITCSRTTSLLTRPQVAPGFDLLSVTGNNVNNVVDNTPAKAVNSMYDQIDAISHHQQPSHYSNRLSSDDFNTTKLNEKTPTGFVEALFGAVQSTCMDSITTEEGSFDIMSVNHNVNFASTDIVSALNIAGDGSLYNNQFNLSFLNSIDPTLIKYRTNVYVDDVPHETEYLSNTGLEATIATNIHNHLTSIGTRLSVVSANMFITNMITNDQISAGLNLASDSIILDIPVFVTSAVRANDHVHRELMLNNFSNRFIAEAGPFLTQQGTTFFTATVEFDRQTTTRVTVQLAGERVAIPFVFGSFATNLISPLLSPDNAGENSIMSGVPSSTDSLVSLLKPIYNGYQDVNGAKDMDMGQALQYMGNSH